MAWSGARMAQHPLAKGEPLEQLHREKDGAILELIAGVDVHHAWVLEPCQGFPLPKEPGDKLRVSSRIWQQELEGHFLPNALVDRSEDVSHSTAAHLAPQSIGTDESA